MSLENLTSALEQSVIPILLIFALVFLFFSGRLILQRMGFGSKPLVTARIFLRSFAKQSLAEVWKRQLSPQLKEKICGEGFADAEALGQGLEHLTAFRERHSVAFPSEQFTLFSVHKVPIGDQYRELLMVRGIAQDSTRGVVVWLTRSTLSSGGWRVDDLYVQPPKTGDKPPPTSLTLSGKVPKKGFMKAAQSSDQTEMDRAVSEEQFTELPEENSLLGITDLADKGTPQPPVAQQTPQVTSTSPKPMVVSQSTQRKDQKITVVKL